LKISKTSENDVLQKKYPFPKKVSNICHVLAGWKNKYGSKYNGMAFTSALGSASKKGKREEVSNPF